MESFPVLLIVVSCLVIALLIFVAVKLILAHLSELRAIGKDSDTKAEAPATEPAPAPEPDPAPQPETIVEKSDLAIKLLAAENIIVVPGYGLAVSQAHFQLGALARSLADKGIEVSFAIHPAAGRMPGHMNILLDEAEVPHAGIFDLESINHRFPACDLALIVGANDVVNPAAREDTDSPNYGMPVLDADKARRVFVFKRGDGYGYSETDNPLFSRENVQMVYGDARDTLQNLLDEVQTDQDLPVGS